MILPRGYIARKCHVESLYLYHLRQHITIFQRRFKKWKNSCMQLSFFQEGLSGGLGGRRPPESGYWLTLGEVATVCILFILTFTTAVICTRYRKAYGALPIINKTTNGGDQTLFTGGFGWSLTWESMMRSRDPKYASDGHHTIVVAKVLTIMQG